MIKSFQDFIVWQKGHKLVLTLYKLTKFFPEEERFGLVSQMRRSAVSICSNIAEGYKKSTRDFWRLLDIAQGSLEETKYHIILSRDLGYFNNDDYTQIMSLTNEVGLMLNSLMKKLIR